MTTTLCGAPMLFGLERRYPFNTLADIGHTGHRHTIAQRAISRAICYTAITAELAGPTLAITADGGVIVGEALKALTLAGRETADGHALLNGETVTFADIAWRRDRARVHAVAGRGFVLKRDRDLSAGIGVAAVVLHCPQCRGEIATVRAVVLGGECDGSDANACAAAVRCQDRVRDAVVTPLQIMRVAPASDSERQWRAAPGAVLAGVKAIGAERVGDGKAAFPFLLAPPVAVFPISAAAGCDWPGYQVVAEFGVSSREAVKARCNCAGSSLPLASARRRIPAQAFGLKKYRCGRSPVSKISDNEDATAALWNSEVLSIENAVGEPIPALPQPSEEGSKSPSSVDRQHPRNILPNQPTGAKPSSKAHKLDGEPAALPSKASAKSRDREILAGSAADKKVNWCIIARLDCGKITMQRHFGIAFRQYRASERVNLGKECGAPAERMPSHGGSFNAGTDAAVNHRPAIHSSVVSTTDSQPDRLPHNTHAIIAPSGMAAVEMMAAMWRAEGMSGAPHSEHRANNGACQPDAEADAARRVGVGHRPRVNPIEKPDGPDCRECQACGFEPPHHGTTRKPSDRSAATVASASQKDGRAPVVGSARPEVKGGMTRGNDATPSDTADLGRNSGSRSGWGAVMFIQRLQKNAV